MTGPAILKSTVFAMNMKSINENDDKESSVAIDHQGSDKAVLKRKLIAIQIRASALRRQLNDVLESNDSTIEVVKDFNNEWNVCFESVSLVHADILACGESIDIDDLDKLACRVEDVLFELKGELSKLRKAQNSRSSPRGRRSSSPACSEFLRIPVDSKSGEDNCENESSSTKHNDLPPPLQPNSLRMTPNYVMTDSRGVVGKFDSRPLHSLNPEAAPYCGRNVGHPLATVDNMQLPLPPAPHLTLESFKGDIVKYWDFKKRFKRHVEDVYLSYDDRMAFLDSLCVGKAHEVIAGIGCLLDSRTAYMRAWDRLDKRFGDVKSLCSICVESSSTVQQ